MDSHEAQRLAFLAGDLQPHDAQAFDEHLLTCEACWRAVSEDRFGRAALQVLNASAPHGLTDRVRFAVEVTARPAQRPLPPRRVVAGAALALLLAGGLVISPFRLHSHAPADSRAVAAVVAFARLMPPDGHAGSATTHGRPRSIGEPLTLQAGGQRLDLVYYRVGSVEAMVATSDRPFATPDGAKSTDGRSGMGWSATRGGVTLYCLNAPRPVLLAAAVPSVQLPAIAAMLGLG